MASNLVNVFLSEMLDIFFVTSRRSKHSLRKSGSLVSILIEKTNQMVHWRLFLFLECYSVKSYVFLVLKVTLNFV